MAFLLKITFVHTCFNKPYPLLYNNASFLSFYNLHFKPEEASWLTTADWLDSWFIVSDVKEQLIAEVSSQLARCRAPYWLQGAGGALIYLTSYLSLSVALPTDPEIASKYLTTRRKSGCVENSRKLLKLSRFVTQFVRWRKWTVFFRTLINLCENPY